MKQKLQSKDLITVGIFTAIYFVLQFVSNMLAVLPHPFVFYPLYLPIFVGIPLMLFIAKIQKPGMFSIMSILLGIILFLFGRSWIPLVLCIVFGIVADLILWSGKYKSMKKSIIAAGVFNLWSIGMVLPVWFLGDSYNAALEASMPEGFVSTILALKQPWVMVLLLVGAFVMGVVGALIGKAVVKKHFVKAGIV